MIIVVFPTHHNDGLTCLLNSRFGRIKRSKCKKIRYKNSFPIKNLVFNM